MAERSQDALGLFAIFGEFSSDLREAQRMNHQQTMTHEAVLELNYMYNATPWLLSLLKIAMENRRRIDTLR